MQVFEKIELREGFIEFQQVADFADIYHIEVKPECRGKGFGTTLMELFLDEMKNRNVTEVTLEVRIDNRVAIRLYENFSFEVLHVRKNYYKDGCDAFLMRMAFRASEKV